MQKALVVVVLLAVVAAALAGPAERLIRPGAPVSQHAEVIIDPPGHG